MNLPTYPLYIGDILGMIAYQNPFMRKLFFCEPYKWRMKQWWAGLEKMSQLHWTHIYLDLQAPWRAERSIMHQFFLFYFLPFASICIHLPGFLTFLDFSCKVCFWSLRQDWWTSQQPGQGWSWFFPATRFARPSAVSSFTAGGYDERCADGGPQSCAGMSHDEWLSSPKIYLCWQCSFFVLEKICESVVFLSCLCWVGASHSMEMSTLLAWRAWAQLPGCRSVPRWNWCVSMRWNDQHQPPTSVSFLDLFGSFCYDRCCWWWIDQQLRVSQNWWSLHRICSSQEKLRRWLCWWTLVQ